MRTLAKDLVIVCFNLSFAKNICRWALFWAKFLLINQPKFYYEAIYIYKSVLIIKLLKVVKINYCKNTFLHRFIWTPLYKSLTATLYLVEQWAENSGVLLKPNWLETKLVKDSYSWFERHNNLIIVRHNSLIIVKKIVKMR